eukprot:2909540-Amphidinium_carterae.2
MEMDLWLAQWGFGCSVGCASRKRLSGMGLWLGLIINMFCIELWIQRKRSCDAAGNVRAYFLFLGVDADVEQQSARAAPT